jgi:hypothetical protein
LLARRRLPRGREITAQWQADFVMVKRRFHHFPGPHTPMNQFESIPMRRAIKDDRRLICGNFPIDVHHGIKILRLVNVVQVS